MKILYFDPKAVTDKTGMYSYYNGTYSELCKLAEVITIRQPINNINEILNNVDDVDAIVFGLGWFAQESYAYYSKISGIESLNIPIICNIHKVANQTQIKFNFFKQNNISLILMSPGMVNKFKKIQPNIKFELFPYAAHPESFYDRSLEKIYDFGFSGAKHAKDKDGGIKKGYTEEKATLRTRIEQVVNEKLTDYNKFWNCSDTPDILLPEEEYSSLLNQSKIWLSTEGPAMEVSPRYYEVILSKTLLMCNIIPDEYGHIFIDGKNCVQFKNDLSDFEEKMKYYLSNDEERQKIIENAYDEFIKNHTWSSRAQQLLQHIEELK